VLLGLILDRLILFFCYCRRFILALESNFSRIYSFLSIHVLIASSTALDKSPFFPPNLSTVLNLSCFSSSSESSTHIRPTFNQLLSVFVHYSHVSHILPVSELPHAKFHVCCFCCHFSFTFNSLIRIIYYMYRYL
jgi:hypothetical protein